MKSNLRTFFATAPQFEARQGPPAPPPPEISSVRSFLSPATAPLLNALVGIALFLFPAIGIVFGKFEPILAVGIGGIFVVVALYLLGDRIVKILLREAAGILFAPYGVHDQKSAEELLYDYIVHSRAPMMIVTNGAVDARTKDSPLTKMGNRGPGFLRVDEASAVLVEHSTKQLYGAGKPEYVVTTTTMRILTLGQHFLDAHDTIRGIVPLNIEEKILNLVNVITKDGIPLTIGLRMYYRISQNEGYLMRNGRYQADGDAVKRAILNGSDWKLQTIVSAESRIRDHIARLNFNQVQGSYPRAVRLVTPEYEEPSGSDQIEDAPRATIQVELVQEINEAVRRWGTEVLAIAVDQITIPEDVGVVLRRAWAAGWENKISFEKADTSARVLKRNSEGRRDAAEFDRTAKLISEQAEVEVQRLHAEATASADRIRKGAQTETSLASIRQFLMVLQEHKINPESPLAQKLFDAMNVAKGGQGRKKDGTSDSDEWPPENPASVGKGK